jgi:uncharacterized protein (TIGR00251 family)
MDVRDCEGGCLIAVKVVPGSRRTQVVGAYGQRLKVKVAAPAEGGRANAALCAVLATALKVPDRSVSVTRGMTSPDKTVRVAGISAQEARERLGV